MLKQTPAPYTYTGQLLALHTSEWSVEWLHHGMYWPALECYANYSLHVAVSVDDADNTERELLPKTAFV